MQPINKIDINTDLDLVVPAFTHTLHEALQVSGHLSIHVKENAMYEAVFLQMGQACDVHVYLEGTQAKCLLKIVYLSSDQKDNKVTTEVIHVHPQTYSHQEIKGVLAGKGKAQFDGVIRIPFDSQKCEGFQNHRAILLSTEALVKCTPELEIYADDVKCAHGSAVGALDENQLFYLKARGIDQHTAQKILIKGFLSEMMPDSYIQKIETWMDEHE